jgi:DNA-binding ferritin-like protein (Dps family)
MDKRKFEEIMDRGDAFPENYIDNAFEGLQLIQKYLPKATLITGAGHNIIYSVTMDELLKTEITEEDVFKLQNMNWMIKNDYLACFV